VDEILLNNETVMTRFLVELEDLIEQKIFLRWESQKVESEPEPEPQKIPIKRTKKEIEKHYEQKLKKNELVLSEKCESEIQLIQSLEDCGERRYEFRTFDARIKNKTNDEIIDIQEGGKEKVDFDIEERQTAEFKQGIRSDRGSKLDSTEVIEIIVNSCSKEPSEKEISHSSYKEAPKEEPKEWMKDNDEIQMFDSFKQNSESKEINEQNAEICLSNHNQEERNPKLFQSFDPIAMEKQNDESKVPSEGPPDQIVSTQKKVMANAAHSVSSYSSSNSLRRRRRRNNKTTQTLEKTREDMMKKLEESAQKYEYPSSEIEEVLDEHDDDDKTGKNKEDRNRVNENFGQIELNLNVDELHEIKFLGYGAVKISRSNSPKKKSNQNVREFNKKCYESYLEDYENGKKKIKKQNKKFEHEKREKLNSILSSKEHEGKKKKKVRVKRKRYLEKIRIIENEVILIIIKS
jgi:hypothetical protein